MGVDILIVGSCLFFPQFGDVMERFNERMETERQKASAIAE